MANDEKEKIIVNTVYFLGNALYWMLFFANMLLLIVCSPLGTSMEDFAQWQGHLYHTQLPESVIRKAYYTSVLKEMSIFIVALVGADVLYRKKHKIWAFLFLSTPYLWALISGLFK